MLQIFRDAILLPFSLGCLIINGCRAETSSFVEQAAKSETNASSESNSEPSPAEGIDRRYDFAYSNSEQNENPFKVCDLAKPLPIKANIYKLAPYTQKLPSDFSALKLESTVCMPDYAISRRSFSSGFPGLSPDFIEWFALDTYTILNIPEDGNYTFFMNSDDGAKLFIDGNLILDNDGIHSSIEKSASVLLTRGEHEVNLSYFQGPRHFIALELFWKTPSSGQKVIVPQSAFKSDVNSP